MTEQTTVRPTISAVAQRIARELGETEVRPMNGIDHIVRLCGEERALAILAQAKDVEASGGMLLPDGSRRHTVGGVFFRLAREQATPAQRARLFPPRNKRTPQGAKPPSAPAAPAVAD